MKLATAMFLAAAALLAGCRQQRYFVDIDRATWGTTAGKRAAEQLAHDGEAKKREVAEASAAATKAEDAKAADAAELRARVNETGQRLQREYDHSREAARQAMVPAVVRALARVAADRHAAVIEDSSTVAYFDPGSDVTAEVIRRADEAEQASEVARLKAENDALKAKAKP